MKVLVGKGASSTRLLSKTITQAQFQPDVENGHVFHASRLVVAPQRITGRTLGSVNGIFTNDKYDSQMWLVPNQGQL